MCMNWGESKRQENVNLPSLPGCGRRLSHTQLQPQQGWAQPTQLSVQGSRRSRRQKEGLELNLPKQPLAPTCLVLTDLANKIKTAQLNLNFR